MCGRSRKLRGREENIFGYSNHCCDVLLAQRLASPLSFPDFKLATIVALYPAMYCTTHCSVAVRSRVDSSHDLARIWESSCAASTSTISVLQRFDVLSTMRGSSKSRKSKENAVCMHDVVPFKI